MSWLAELEAVSAGFFEQATRVNIRKMDNKYSARERMIFSSDIKFVTAKTVIEAGEARKRNRTIRPSGGLYGSMLSVR